MNFLKSLISKVAGFFKSGKAETALNQAAALVPQALAIVQALDALAPNKTMDEINRVAQKYGVVITGDMTNGVNPGLALLHVGSIALGEQVPGTATSILNAAVQLATTGLHAK